MFDGPGARPGNARPDPLSVQRNLSTMAFQVLKILQAVAPLVAEAGRVAMGLRKPGAGAQPEDRLLKLEQEAVRAAEIIRRLAEQLQAVAQELRAQSEATAAFRRRMIYLLGLSLLALGMGIAALVTSLMN